MLGWLLISKREWVRHQRELVAALKRAERAETALAAEREKRDVLLLQLTDRVLTRHGAYGLESEPPQTTPQIAPRTDGFLRDPTEDDIAYRDLLIQNALAQGHSEDDALRYWRSVMQGKPMTMIDEEQ